MTYRQIKETNKGFYCTEPCCEIKELKEKLLSKEQECEMLNKQLISFMNGDYCKNDCSLKQQLKRKKQECEKLKKEIKKQKEIAKEYEQRWLNSYGV